MVIKHLFTVWSRCYLQGAVRAQDISYGLLGATFSRIGREKVWQLLQREWHRITKAVMGLRLGSLVEVFLNFSS